MYISSTAQEVNELVQLFINIGESIPQQRAQEHAEGVRRTESTTAESGPESGVKLLSLLDSCRLSLDVRGRGVGEEREQRREGERERGGGRKEREQRKEVRKEGVKEGVRGEKVKERGREKEAKKGGREGRKEGAKKGMKEGGREGNEQRREGREEREQRREVGEGVRGRGGGKGGGRKGYIPLTHCALLGAGNMYNGQHTSLNGREVLHWQDRHAHHEL